ncbi:unnamed protein product [Mytilus edulis]|uniref:Fucolectin tachylectin-4 pentraxin-1 domain-containing protein n=1 Tax=Mytilus edulis TaxID=6550 RepID=A0A8S3R140_MYTED|nr:unnamed protein product [Mytilus edulis]
MQGIGLQHIITPNPVMVIYLNELDGQIENTNLKKYDITVKETLVYLNQTIYSFLMKSCYAANSETPMKRTEVEADLDYEIKKRESDNTTLDGLKQIYVESDSPDSTCRIKAKQDILKQMSNISTYIVAHSIYIRVAHANLNTLSTNKRLHAAIAKGFTYHSFDHMSPRACFKECIRRPRCFSYNYNKVHFTCEINLKPDSDSLVYFLNVVGYIYVVIQHHRGNPLFDPCIGHPCSTDEVCESLKNNKTVCVKDGFNIPHKTFLNVALRKYTQQISTAESDLSASKAVDGLSNTWSRTNLELFPYLWVDLGTIYNIIRIEIINRNAYGYRLHDLDITVGLHLDHMTMCAHYTGPGTNGERLVFQCKGWYIESRFVKMKIIKGSEYLQFGEIKVFGYQIIR